MWREDLEVGPDYLARHTTFVLQLLPGQETAGFCVISEEAPYLWVEHLWVLPEYIGSGYGSALLQEAFRIGKKPGFSSINVIADPFAAGFYARMGFATVGYHPGKPGDRQLPIMERPARPTL